MEKTPHKVYSENMFLLIKKISSESSLFLYVFLQCCNHFKLLPVNFSFPVQHILQKNWFMIFKDTLSRLASRCVTSFPSIIRIHENDVQE